MLFVASRTDTWAIVPARPTEFKRRGMAVESYPRILTLKGARLRPMQLFNFDENDFVGA